MTAIVYEPQPTSADIEAMSARVAKVEGSSAVFVPGTFTVDTLPAPAAAMVGMYARVTDLFGEKRDLVLCSQVGDTFFWQPVRQQYAKTMTLAADMPLTTLKSPTIVLLAGTLGANRNITLSNIYAYPGASFEVGFDGNLGLFGITLRNHLGSSLGSLLGGGRRRFFFADGNWQNF